MTDQLQYKGYWYLPDKPEEAVAGVLTYIPKKSISLELIGSFEQGKSSIEAFLNKKEEKIIHGIASDAKKITLIDCYPSGSANFSCPFPIIRYSCQYLIIGKHIKSLAEPSFFKARVFFPVLAYWCHPCALQNVVQYDENKEVRKIIYSFDVFNDENEDTIHKIQVSENTHLYLKKGVKFDGSKFLLNPKVEQYTSLEIHKQNDSSLEEYLSDIFLYGQFLSFATLEAVACSKIYLYDRDLYQELENGKKIYHPLELIYIQLSNENDATHTEKYNFLFDYNTIEHQYSQIIQKWFAEKEDIAPIRTHLVESIKHKNIFSSIDFLIVVQALEGFCTRFRKERKNDSLRNMLQDIIAEFSCINKIKNDDIAINEVVNSRHYYSHFMERSKKKHILNGQELYDLTHKLRKLLICCVLHFIGFNYAQINEILNKSNSHLLARRSFD